MDVYVRPEDSAYSKKVNRVVVFLFSILEFKHEIIKKSPVEVVRRGYESKKISKEKKLLFFILYGVESFTINTCDRGY